MNLQLTDRILTSLSKMPTIGVVGIVSWDTVLAIDEYPGPGGYALVESGWELPGGTSANAAVAAAALGARVDLVSATGRDPVGERLRRAIADTGVDVSRIRIDPDLPTDQTTVITSREPANRTIFWRQGAIPRMGDQFDIDRLFTRNLVLVDSVDPALRRFLIDLPVHTYPDVKILVPMTYVIDFPGLDELASLLRSDALVGSEHELCQLLQADTLAAAIKQLQKLMRTSNLRSVAVTRGANGAIAFDVDEVFTVPALQVKVIDTTGAGDAFAGAFAVGLASRMSLSDSLELANTVAGLSTRAVGAQAGVPKMEEVTRALIDERAAGHE